MKVLEFCWSNRSYLMLVPLSCLMGGYFNLTHEPERLAKRISLRIHCFINLP